MRFGVRGLRIWCITPRSSDGGRSRYDRHGSTQDLRVAWRQLHRTGPPLGLSRDLLIRALADELQQRAHGSPSRALRRRLQSLAEASEKGTMAVNPGLVLKAGTTLVRQWRGHTLCKNRVRNRLSGGGEWIRTFSSGASGEADAFLPVKDRPR
jgi:hypothetical protein